jgi:hypothetical protein
LALLKKRYIGFGDSRVLSMIHHLCQKTAIKMTTAQKHEYKAARYNNPWDPTTSITTYLMQLDRFQVSLGDRGIGTRDAEKTMAAGEQMCQSEMFTEDQMVTWENKTAHSRHGPSSRHTSPRNGWNASNTLPRRLSNHTSKRQCFTHRRQQKLKTKVSRKQCCLQFCWNSTIEKLPQ